MLSKERIGEIAYMLLKENTRSKMRIRSVSNSSEVKKRIGDVAKKLKISREELLSFIKIIGSDVLQEANAELQSVKFGKSSSKKENRVELA